MSLHDWSNNKEAEQILAWADVSKTHPTSQQTQASVVYLMGDAGTGKSTLINDISYVTSTTPVAPTNTAAINVNGTTYFKSMSIIPGVTIYDLLDPTNERRFIATLTQRNYIQSEIFVVDEVSMIDAEMMDIIFLLHLYRTNTSIGRSHILNASRLRGRSMSFINDILNNDAIKIPKILISGDFGQLPPVLKRDRRKYLEGIYQSPYAFDSFFWRALEHNDQLETIRLTHNYRQSNPDNDPTEKTFTQYLQDIKYNKLDSNIIDFFNHKTLTKEIYNNLSPKPLLLSTTNARVNDVNARNLMTIEDKPTYILESTISYKSWNKLDEDAKRILRANKGGQAHYGKFIQEVKNSNKATQKTEVQLKEGCQIMVTGNDYKNNQFYNGQIGQLISVAPDKKSITANLYDNETEERREVIIPEQFIKITEQVYDKDTHRLRSVELGTYKGIPVTLGYAITVHKSQGKSLESLIIDPNDGMYEENQAYVSLSRATNYAGLYLYRPIKMNDIKYNSYILEWMSSRIK